MVALAGKEDVAPLRENGLLTGEGTRERFPSGEGERDASSSGCAKTRMDQHRTYAYVT